MPFGKNQIDQLLSIQPGDIVYQEFRKSKVRYHYLVLDVKIHETLQEDEYFAYIVRIDVLDLCHKDITFFSWETVFAAWECFFVPDAPVKLGLIQMGKL